MNAKQHVSLLRITVRCLQRINLIFEKINGHKDGSVFTPGFITMFMCREAITKTVLQKFNGYYGWNCTTRIELYNHIDNIV